MAEAAAQTAPEPSGRYTVLQYVTRKAAQVSQLALALHRCRSVPEGYKVLTEGQASILQKGNDVFYNPAQASRLFHLHAEAQNMVDQQNVYSMQVVNRDISIAVLRQFVKQKQLEQENGTAPGSKHRVRGGVLANINAAPDKVSIQDAHAVCGPPAYYIGTSDVHEHVHMHMSVWRHQHGLAELHWPPFWVQQTCLGTSCKTVPVAVSTRSHYVIT